MIPLSRNEMRAGIIFMHSNKPYDAAKHYYFSKGKLYHTWKPNDVKAATVIFFNYVRDFLANISFFTGGIGCLPFTSKTHLVSNCANGTQKFRLENPVRCTRFPFPIRSEKNGNIS